MQKELSDILNSYQKTKDLKYLKYYYEYIAYLFYSGQIKEITQFEKKIPRSDSTRYLQKTLAERQKMYQMFLSIQPELFSIIGRTLGVFPKSINVKNDTKTYCMEEIEEYLQDLSIELYNIYQNLKEDGKIVFSKKVETSCAFLAPNNYNGGIILKENKKNGKLSISEFQTLVHELSHILEYQLQEKNGIIIPTFDREVLPLYMERKVEDYLSSNKIKNDNDLIRLSQYHEILKKCFTITKKILNGFPSINYKYETISVGADTNIIIDCYKYMISNYLAASLYKEYNEEEVKKNIANLNRLNLPDLIKLFKPEDYISEVKTLVKNKKM